MNLKETFIWNVITGLSVLTIIYFLYLEYNNYKEYNIVRNEFEKQETGTDKELLEKIKDLESKMEEKAQNKFIFKQDDPTDLTRIIKIEGMENYYNVSANEIKVFAKVGNRAIVQYNGKTHKIALGDTIGGGKITVLNNDELIFVKDGKEQSFSFKRRIK